ncbi:twin arginine-targeting protein translocase TatB [Amylibacter kogurei]|uniref:Sec-independent protein translocase protein TatB n=1 Tax=Paramylibacter kogurei TaxID=1889778 RepID=A0A2G5K6L5_9RHOB|nr:Sec-independent protein translocase protein TatB [Amylibacter kogurei]PIB24344.1 twin arginine-targeting protein translocase TatB [Amylibacter kogurei]
MFDIGMAEMLVIGVVALIVVGPKDLPMMFRKVGNFVGRARGMARDFQRAMDQAADDTGIKDIGDTVRKATDIKDLGVDTIKDPMKSYADNFGSGAKSASDTSASGASGATAKTASKTTATKTAAKKPAKAAAKKTTKTATKKTAKKAS